MATIVEFQKRLQKLDSDTSLELILFVEIKRHEKVFIEANKLQLSFGKDNKGEIIGTYTEATENWDRGYTPRKPKIAGEPYNFEDTGRFFDGFELLVDGKEAQFWSTDEKTPFLVAQYKDIFGLRPENLKDIIKRVILPAFILQIRKHLLLN